MALNSQQVAFERQEAAGRAAYAANTEANNAQTILQTARLEVIYKENAKGRR